MENLYFVDSFPSIFLCFFLALYSFILPPTPFNMKISAAERGKADFSSTVVSSSQLPFLFLKHTLRLIASKPGLNVVFFSL